MTHRAMFLPRVGLRMHRSRKHVVLQTTPLITTDPRQEPSGSSQLSRLLKISQNPVYLLVMKLFRRGDQTAKAAEVLSAIGLEFASNLTQTNHICFWHQTKKTKQQAKADHDIDGLQSPNVINRYDTGEILTREVWQLS